MKRGAQSKAAVSQQEDGTFERVKRIIVEQLGVDEGEVTPDAKFFDDFGIDSLDEIELVMAAEEEFGMEIPDGDVRTPQEAVDGFRRMWGQPHQWAFIQEKLRGKDLACWCPLDQPCHADVLLEIANAD